MKKSGKIFMVSFLATLLLSFALPNTCFAKNTDSPRAGEVSGKSVGAAALSLFIWPGIGQAVNNDKGDKVMTHVIFGLLPPYRIWSAYDALVDRKGGYWKGRI